MTKGTTSKPEVFIALAQAYEAENTLLTDKIEAILTPELSKLPDVLQAKLDAVGDTPISEPDRYKMLQDNNRSGFFRSFEGVNGFDALEVGTFLSRATSRIMSFVDADGVFKTTPSLAEMRLPKMDEIYNITDLTEAGATEGDLEALVYPMVSVDPLVLSDWEKQLCKEIVSNFIRSSAGAAIGLASDKTPFSRYLKNT